MKTQIYNLIVLDESGSMSCVTKQTIDGCNETINTIRSSQKEFADTQEHFVSIFAFQSGGSRPSRYLIKNLPIERVHHISSEDYDPCGCTPLYDAVGGTLTDLKEKIGNDRKAIANVTIITDGMENSSTHYTLEKVAKMIEALKELGWSFNFIGANIDVDYVSKRLHIDNAMAFQQDEEGTKAMFEKERRSRKEWLKRSASVMNDFMACPSEAMCEEDLREYRRRMKEAGEGYFKE